MPSDTDPGVRVHDEPARTTAVRKASTTWSEFPSLWPQLSADVWTCLRAGGVTRGCPNVMLYRDRPDGGVDVEIGVELRVPCELTGAVVASTLPGGQVASVEHRGPWSRMDQAYQTFDVWREANHVPKPTVHWEVYGPHSDDPAELTMTIFWLLG
ncbi:GyrI-like domain-containing protein [Microlunatus sp. Gsoil 973]|uniref:GyrI-like domain-containing protein n=1 Tax=Microlunatus sp. Gsoil 973 TaxID=2672569 RepID=UPI0018A81867|nr:GyrI-like domain-containing protein [Microlunatus sp. Gsoil 973]